MDYLGGSSDVGLGQPVAELTQDLGAHAMGALAIVEKIEQEGLENVDGSGALPDGQRIVSAEGVDVGEPAPEGVDGMDQGEDDRLSAVCRIVWYTNGPFGHLLGIGAKNMPDEVYLESGSIDGDRDDVCDGAMIVETWGPAGAAEGIDQQPYRFWVAEEVDVLAGQVVPALVAAADLPPCGDGLSADEDWAGGSGGAQDPGDLDVRRGPGGHRADL